MSSSVVLPGYSHRVTEPQSALGWKGPASSPCSNPLPWTGTLPLDHIAPSLVQPGFPSLCIHTHVNPMQTPGYKKALFPCRKCSDPQGWVCGRRRRLESGEGAVWLRASPAVRALCHGDYFSGFTFEHRRNFSIN